jgi:hypothetical protein
MTEAEAAAWHGRVLRYDPTEATSGADTCREATYDYRTAPAKSVLADYGVAPSSLELPAERDLGVTEVSCGESPWNAMGSVLLWAGDGRVFVPRDGVFFEVRRAAPLSR